MAITLFKTIYSSIEREKVTEVEHILADNGVAFREDEQLGPSAVYLPFVGSIGSLTALENLECLYTPLTLRVRVRRQDVPRARAVLAGRLPPSAA